MRDFYNVTHKYFVVVTGIWLPRYKNKIKDSFLWLSAIILTKIIFGFIRLIKGFDANLI